MLCYYGDDMEEYRRWEDNIRMNLKEIGNNTRNWVDAAKESPCECGRISVDHIYDRKDTFRKA